MNVLVIGGTRFFGIHTIESLIANGHDVTIATRGIHSDAFGERVSRVVMDRADEDSVRKALGEREFDVVIDKVAYSSDDVRALLKNVRCGRYIQMSSCAVYRSEHLLIAENEFDAKEQPLCWSGRTQDYAEGKRQAERAALEFMDAGRCVFVRFPVVLGVNDYTNRLRFYVEHICKKVPMFIENPDAAVSYINENEAGGFIAHLVDVPLSGAVNGCSEGIVSQSGIIGYIEKRSSERAVLSDNGDPSPYNGISADTSYDCTKAKAAGFSFSDIGSWLYELIDHELSAYR